MPLPAGEIERLAEGLHRHPCSILGLQPCSKSGHQLLRVWAPAASRVELLTPLFKRLRKRHAAGIFECLVASGGDSGVKPTIRVELPDGHVEEGSDSYLFPPALSDLDTHLLGEGTHYRSYEKLGAHLTERDGVEGVCFAVWAPNARGVAVIGDFNRWHSTSHPMESIEAVGVWQLFVPGIQELARYKYCVRTQDGRTVDKVDPYAFHFETPPRSACQTYRLRGYKWQDEEWCRGRARKNSLDAPISIYEVHLGSWRPGLSYRDLAETLVDYVAAMGFTHIELLPVTEHPFGGSWGYQPIGYFAPTSRFGTPDDFRYFVDVCHQRGLGVLLDWVPGHFPKDEHGLARFDGTHLFEHSDPRRGEHPDWGTLVFNLGRREVRNFLISSALFWIREFHLDGLRVDAVASLLYLDYSRKEGEWIPNQYGGREDLDAVRFLQDLNEVVHESHPDVLMIAEESTSWPGVTRPGHLGGLGFDLKWNMGWMHDSLDYMSLDPVFRGYHHDQLTFSMFYAFSEKFLLPLSHDEVVHGKGSLLEKMWGDDWKKRAGLRILLTYMYTHPGKKILFMGAEFGQSNEWDSSASLDWHLLEIEGHARLHAFVTHLNHLYATDPALFEQDFNWEGFEWLDLNDYQHSVISFMRKPRSDSPPLLMVLNFTPEPRSDYRLGVPPASAYAEVLNSDAAMWGGSNLGNLGRVEVESVESHGRSQSVVLTLPPLSALILRPEA